MPMALQDFINFMTYPDLKVPLLTLGLPHVSRLSKLLKPNPNPK